MTFPQYSSSNCTRHAQIIHVVLRFYWAFRNESRISKNAPSFPLLKVSYIPLFHLMAFSMLRIKKASHAVLSRKECFYTQHKLKPITSLPHCSSITRTLTIQNVTLLFSLFSHAYGRYIQLPPFLETKKSSWSSSRIPAVRVSFQLFVPVPEPLPVYSLLRDTLLDCTYAVHIRRQSYTCRSRKTISNHRQSPCFLENDIDLPYT